MDVKYTTKGPKGKTCADCKFFEKGDAGLGKCYGIEVLAGGSCVMFNAKAAKE
jgi:hypothetical protein